MPLAHFTNIDTATHLWVASAEYFYIGPKSKYFTKYKSYEIFGRGSVFYNDKGKCRIDVKLKNNFIIWWKYPQYLRKIKLEKIYEEQRSTTQD